MSKIKIIKCSSFDNRYTWEEISKRTSKHHRGTIKGRCLQS